MNDLHHVVIVGGGFGGLYAARNLKNAPVRVTLVDRRNFHLFQPLLYQVATASLSPANIAAPLRFILKKQDNAHVLLGDVVDFKTAEKQVVLKDGDLRYDSLIVAAGSENNYFGHNDWEDIAPGLKTLEDATRLRRRILYAFERAERETDPVRRRAWLTFVLVGAGPTGVELAGSLGEIARDTLRHEFRSIRTDSARILLIDTVDRVLMSYPPELSQKALEALSRLGVTVLMKSMVTGMMRGFITIKSGEKEETIAAETVMWSAGVKASPLGQLLAKETGVPVEKSGRLRVGPDLTLPGHPNVFVIGDMALAMGDNGQPLPGIAPVAMQEGRYAAQLIAARADGRGLPPFRYRHHGDMATIGRAAAVANFGTMKFNGFLAWVAWLFVHLWFIIEFEDRLLVFTQWAWNYFTRNRGARLITGEWDSPAGSSSVPRT